jgi:hypothetical protein
MLFLTERIINIPVVRAIVASEGKGVEFLMFL